MNEVKKEFSCLWNELPDDERIRLMPYMIESQILHIWQCKQKAIKAHDAHLRQLDEWMCQLQKDLDRAKQ